MPYKRRLTLYKSRVKYRNSRRKKTDSANNRLSLSGDHPEKDAMENEEEAPLLVSDVRRETDNVSRDDDDGDIDVYQDDYYYYYDDDTDNGDYDDDEEEEEEEEGDDADDGDEDGRSRKTKKKKTVGTKQDYFNLIKEGPTGVCTCCGKLIFPRHGRKFMSRKFEGKYGRDFVDKIKQVEFSDLLCSTCYKKVLKGNLPEVSISNGYKLDDPPEALRDLSILEERMVSPRIPFMQIRTRGYYKNKFLKGHVVNVPTDIDKMVKILPRQREEMEVVQIKLKRRERNRGAYIVDTVRPGKIKAALEHLLTTPLYVEHQIKADWNKLPDDTTATITTTDKVPFVVDDDDDYDDDDEVIEDETVAAAAAKDDDNVDDDDDVDVETMLYNFTKEANEAAVVSVIFTAVAEGTKPLSFIRDKYVEELTFPTIYHGQFRPRQVTATAERKISFSAVLKSEMLFYKRYCCRPDKIFFDFKLKQTLEMFNGISLYIRQKRTGGGKGGKVAVSDLLDDTRVSSMVRTDMAYSFMKNIRSSPSFWHSEKQKLFAMVRQLGVPTFFLTLSAADAKWNELLVVLAKILRGNDLTSAEADRLDENEKTELIRRDPVTVVRYFDNRIRLLWVEMRKRGRANRIFGDGHELLHHYYRVEFQHRGAPHVHAVIYLRNAVTFDGSNEAECAAFIDKFVTAAAVNPQVADPAHIVYQKHAHSISCGKTASRRRRRQQQQQQQQPPSSGRCRYGIPFYPMRRTRILGPFNDDDDDDDDKMIDKQSAEENLKKIRKLLEDDRFAAAAVFHHHDDDDDDDNDNDDAAAASLDQFLESLQLTEDQYVEAIRSDLKKHKVFLKRDVRDVFLNPYNVNILNMHQANMDIQFVLDTYTCMSYIVNYINKADSGTSKLMAEAQEHIRAGDMQTKEKLRRLGNVFLGSTEVSIQEAAYHNVGLRLTNCSNKHVFVPTFPPQDRVKMVKPKAALRQMDITSEDVFMRGTLDHYGVRPVDMEDVTLARFATEYVYFKSATAAGRNAQPLTDGSGFVRKLTTAPRRILQFRHYRVVSDAENFYRENLMLFVPWRNEQTDIMSVRNFREAYESNLKRIRGERSLFVKIEHDRIEDAEEDVRRDEQQRRRIEDDNDDDDDDDDEDDQIEDVVYDGGRGIGGDYDDDDDDDIDFLSGLTEYCQGVYDDTHRDDDDDDDAAGRRTGVGDGIDTRIKKSVVVDEEKLFAMVATLNYRQALFFGHFLEAVSKAEKEPFYVFVAGGAGVGKSHLIKTVEMAAIYQLRRKRRPDGGTLPTNRRVILICAPTGKAAYNVNGSTLHSTLHLPVNQLIGPLVPLSDSVLNTVRCELADLKVLIVDEISMVGGKMLNNINLRLQQIFANDSVFGGVSLLVFGDLRQLPPVGDCYLFNANRKNVNVYCDIVDDYMWSRFKYYELTEIMRQKEDKLFAEALNRMAEGKMTKDDVAIFRRRHVGEKFEGSDIPREAICLLRTNKEVDAFNNERLRLYADDVAVSEAVDVVNAAAKVSDKLRRQFLNSVKRLPAGQCFGLAVSVPLHVGARYMMTVNVDVTDGLVNGACCVLRSMERSERDASLVTRLWLEFEREEKEGDNDDDDGGRTPVGEQVRRKFTATLYVGSSSQHQQRRQQRERLAAGWVPLERCARQIKTKRGFSDIFVERRQFPVTPAEAITVHKAQGATYQTVAVHLGKYMPKSSLYVACSRVTKSSGLYLFGDEFKAPSHTGKNEDPVDKELKAIKKDPRRQLLIPMERMLRGRPPSTVVKLTYQNVQSFLKHRNLVESDPQFVNVDVVVLVETWLKSGDLKSAPPLGFDVICNLATRADDERGPSGILCLRRKGSDCTADVEMTCVNTRTIGKFQMVKLRVQSVWSVYVVYVPPSARAHDTIQFLSESVRFQDERLVLVGDFNTNWPENSSVKRYLCQTHGLRSLLHEDDDDDDDYNRKRRRATTWSDTFIDWCLSNEPAETRAQVGATIFSHHKPIVMNLLDQTSRSTPSPASLSRTPPPPPRKKMVPKRKIITKPPLKTIAAPAPPPPPPPPAAAAATAAETNSPSQMSEERRNVIVKFVGLRNTDGVSCYANAVTKCLLNIEPFSAFLSTGRTRLERLLLNVQNATKLDTLSVRAHLGREWQERRQQDCQEFFTELLNNLTPRYRDELQVNYCSLITCLGCGMQRQEERGVTFTLMVQPALIADDDDDDAAASNTYDFERLFRQENHHRRCNECRSDDAAFSTTLNVLHAGSHMVLWFVNYLTADRVNVYRCRNFDADNVRIGAADDNNVYKAIAVVYHRGATCQSGHYYADVRDRAGDRLWTRYDDDSVTLLPKFDDRLERCTLMFLKRIPPPVT